MMDKNFDLSNDISDQFANSHNFINFEEMSPDLQKKLKKINKLPNGLYEAKFKIDRYKFDRACKNELSEMNALQNLFQDIMTETGTQIILNMKTKSNSKLRNPLVNVIGSFEGINLAKEKILSVFENIKMRVVLKMDVSYKDHSHIIGRGGFSIQRVMDDTGSHIHFPDSNRVSDIKKSNVVLVCGSPTGVEQARCKIRNLLPLVVHFKIPLEFLKRVVIESYSKSLRSIQQAYNVHISIRHSHDIDESYATIFDSSRTSKYIAVSVRGANNDLPKLKESLGVLINRLCEPNSNLKSINFILTIEITEFYHQLVMGTNFCNIKNIMQQTNCVIQFPDVETNQRLYDFDNLNEIPVNKSTVIIRGGSFESVHQAWKELIGYLPLVLTFDLAHDHSLDTSLLHQLKKQFKVAIFLKHKEKFNTVIIRGMEKNSRALFEVRKQLLKLEDAEIPICCDNHHLSNNKLIVNQNDENAGSNNILNNLMNSPTSGLNSNTNNLNILNGLLNNNVANILNAKMIQNIDSNNNLPNANEKNHFMNGYNSNMLNMNSNDQVQNLLKLNSINPLLYHAALQEQFSILQQQNPQFNLRNKGFQQNNLANSINAQSNVINALANSGNLNDEVSKIIRQQNLFDHSLRNTHSVNDLTSLQSNLIYQNETPHQVIKKEHLTTSCSSPSLHAMVMQHNDSNSSLLNNFSMNNGSLNSTGNNTSATASGSNATASTANNSFCSNGLNSSPPNSNSNSSFNSSLIANQSPIHANNMNWPDQRRLNYDECRYLALKSTYEKSDANEVRIPSGVWAGYGFSKSMSNDAIRSKLNEQWNPLLSNSNALSTNLNPNSNKSNNLAVDAIGKMNVDLASNSNENFEFAWPEMLNDATNYRSSNKQRALIKQESEIYSSTHPYSSNYLNNLIKDENIRQQLISNNNSNDLQIAGSNNQQQIIQNCANDHQNLDYIDVNKIDLSTVLLEFDLSKYIDTFKQFKIDFAQFLSLTEEDLSKLGIQFVGRRKIYLAIIELRKLLKSNSISNNFARSTNIENIAKQHENNINILSASRQDRTTNLETNENKAIISYDNHHYISNSFDCAIGDNKLDQQKINENGKLSADNSLNLLCNALDSFKLQKNNDSFSKMNTTNESANDKFEIIIDSNLFSKTNNSNENTNDKFELAIDNNELLDDKNSKSSQNNSNEILNDKFEITIDNNELLDIQNSKSSHNNSTEDITNAELNNNSNSAKDANHTEDEYSKNKVLSNSEQNLEFKKHNSVAPEVAQA